MKTLRQFFCKHRYLLVHWEHYSEGMLNGALYVWCCTKCGKFKKEFGAKPPNIPRPHFKTFNRKDLR